MRFPLKFPFTKDDIEQLDAYHYFVGLGELWIDSKERARIMNTYSKEKDNVRHNLSGD